MSRTIRLSVIAVLAALALAVAACSGGGANSPATATPTTSPALSGQSFPVRLQRSDGKTVTLQQAPKRLISLSPGATEIIYAIGAEDELAAVDNQADYPQAAKDFATKVDAFQPNVEAIAALTPDLVFVATDVDGLVAALDRLGIPVLFSDLNGVKTLEDVYGQITLVGSATGRTRQAQTLVDSLRKRANAVAAKVTGVTDAAAPSVYHEVDSTYYSASDQTFIGSLYKILHAKNIAGDGGGSPYPQLTQEKIIAADPDVIILADEPFGTTVESVKQRPGWQNITAVKGGRIYAIDPGIASRAGPRIIDALEQLAKDIYPERFP